MAGRLIEGGKTALNAALYGVSDFRGLYQSDKVVLNEFNNNAVVRNTTEKFNRGLDEIRRVYLSDDMINLSNQIILEQGSLLNNYAINLIDDENITSANLIMQSVIISNPTVSDLDNKGLIRGYDSAVRIDNLDLMIRDSNTTIIDDVITTREYYSTEFDDWSDSDLEAVNTAWVVTEKLIGNSIDPTDEELSLF